MAAAVVALIALLSCWTAYRVARPIRIAARKSNQIARNIGTELFTGVVIHQGFTVGIELDAPPVVMSKASRVVRVCLRARVLVKEAVLALWGLTVEDPGEISAMGIEFDGLLQRLMNKQTLAKKPPPPNPFIHVVAEGVVLQPANPEGASRRSGSSRRRGIASVLTLASPVPSGLDAPMAGSGKHRLTKYNRIKRQITCRVLVPIMVGVVLVISSGTERIVARLAFSTFPRLGWHAPISGSSRPLLAPSRVRQAC